MVMALTCKLFPCWPIAPLLGGGALLFLLGIAGVIFSIVMLIDCLKRPISKFYYPLTKGGEYDRLIWAAAILLSLSFYFVGAIVYFFVIWRGKPQTSEQAQSQPKSTIADSQKSKGESQKDSQ
jgi:hypothetical protein